MTRPQILEANSHPVERGVKSFGCTRCASNATSANTTRKRGDPVLPAAEIMRLGVDIFMVNLPAAWASPTCLKETPTS